MVKTSFVPRIFCVCAAVVDVVSALGQKPVVAFAKSSGALHLASPSLTPTILVNAGDWWGVNRAAADLAVDFGRVTGTNGTVSTMAGALSSSNTSTSAPLIIVGTIGKSNLIDTLVSNKLLNVSAVQGQWEAFTTVLINNPAPGIAQALVVAGSDKRGTIYGIYDISEQIGVSPWYWWADVNVKQNNQVWALAGTKVQASPSVKYRGIFLNDEAPALTSWVETNFPALKYGPGFGTAFYDLVFELLLRLNANYLWPAEWNSMFYVDQATDAPSADNWGIVIGTSHTEPLARATKEQSLFLNGVWSWQFNQANVTQFLAEGVARAAPYETLWTMGMRGLGDTASPTLTAAQLQQIIGVEQQLLMQGLNTTNLNNVPQMWCIYKEVGGYYEQGLSVPDDVTILWADDNWGNPERLPIGNETQRLAGSGIYYHFDYVGAVRDYKWINTINLINTQEKLLQTYDRMARQIWVFNVGDLKPLEIPIHYAMSLAYNVDLWRAPNGTDTWLQAWAAAAYNPNYASQIADIMMTYSMLAGRRKYELMSDNLVYSLINYNEADTVLAEWQALADSANAIYKQLGVNAKPSFFEMVLHPVLAGQTVYQIYINAAKNNIYAEQGRTSANTYAAAVLDYSKTDASLTQQYNSLLNGKWSHMMDQTHLGYEGYWQQPMRNTLPALGYVQTQLNSLTGLMGVTCEANNGTVPGDDQYHGNGGGTLTLPPMDPYMSTPSRWIDVFSRGTDSFNYYVNISVPYITATPVSGTLQASGSASNTDQRVYLTVDWTKAPAGTTTVTMQVTTTSGGNFPFGQQNQYGSQYNAATISVTLNNNKLPAGFSGFVESDKTISIEPEHFTSNVTSAGATAYYAILPGYGRTLSGVSLLPGNAPVQAVGAGPKLTYSFYTFDSLVNASVIVSIGATLNTDPKNPVSYAVAIDSAAPVVVQPIPITTLGTYGSQWTQMVSNFSTWNSSMFTNVAAGAHTLNLWALTPATTFQKVVIDMGGLRNSYLGPPESMRV